ncbi:hypothetical protein BZA70DRAFT_268184 [Myxozyma melibiosi]|uniref:Cytochrome c oxidase assembly factor 3 n=1 Tax=Myxozyma melibiosi TaxID=54550 RepID=A0ABR1F3B5_9ASCO
MSSQLSWSSCYVCVVCACSSTSASLLRLRWLTLFCRWGHNKYQDPYGRMTPALMRARAKYAKRNIITGLALSTFVVGTYAYSATAAGADDFSDVPTPPISEAALKELQANRAAIEKEAESMVTPRIKDSGEWEMPMKQGGVVVSAKGETSEKK